MSIYRKKKKSSIEFPINQPPIYIELVGVSGVGKSTFYQSLLKEQQDFWTIADFKKSLPNVSAQPFIDKAEFYEELAKAQWKHIQELAILDTDKLRMAHWNYKTLTEDALIVNYNKNAIILSDEGILHNFQHSLMKIKVNSSKDFKDFLKNRMVIYCYSDAEKIVAQIIDRQNKTGRVISHHKSKSKEELLEIVENDLREKEEFLKVLENHPIPILKINTQNDLSENVTKVKELIKKLKKQ